MKKLLYLFAVLFFFSCEDEIEIEHPVSDPILVIDGSITTEFKKHTVKISYSSPSKSTDPEVVVNDATVSVMDGKGNVIPFVLKADGVYETVTSIAAQIGDSYALTIKLANGEIIQSVPERIVEVPEIDSIYYLHISEYEYKGGPPREIDQEEEGYYTFIDFQETVGNGSAYRWKAYIDDVLLNGPEYITIESDISRSSSFTKDGVYETQFDFAFLAPQYSMVKIEMYSTSQAYYQYMLTLFINSLDGGSPFSTPPAPPKGNLFYEKDPNGTLVLGYFNASDVVSKSVAMNGSKK